MGRWDRQARWLLAWNTRESGSTEQVDVIKFQSRSLDLVSEPNSAILCFESQSASVSLGFLIFINKSPSFFPW